MKKRMALSRLRTSSHTLQIEKGRHAKPKLPIEERICVACHSTEDEMHFVMHCNINSEQRKILWDKIAAVNDNFVHMNPEEMFTYLLSSNDQRIINWVAKFVHASFGARCEFIQGVRI